MVSYNPNLPFWENLNNSVTYTNLLCAFLTVILLIGYFTAKTEEKKNEMLKYMLIGSIVIMFALASSTLIQQSIKKYSSIPIASTENEKKEINKRKQYESLTAKENCRVCGENTKELINWYWGENNIAIIDLNTFDFFRLEINRYDDDKNLIEKKAGYMSMNGRKFQNGVSMYFHTDTDRGYAEGTIELNEESKLSFDNLSAHLCSDCLTELMNQYTYDEEHWNIALLNFENKKIRPLEKSVIGFGMGDFSVRSKYDKENNKISLLIWFSPVRYE